jgi:AmmeMemoRadiSam system protein B
MKFFKIILSLCLLSAFITTTLNAQYTRSVKDTVGFAWTSVDMDRFIGYLNKNADKGNFAQEGLIGGLSPHDDYLYAGKVYYPLYRNIQAREFVIIGVTHGTVRKALNDQQDIIVLDNFDLWTGPYKTIKASPLREEIKKNLDPRYFTVNDEAQSLEHSIEALLPFIQHYNREIKITPIMITTMDINRMETITEELAKIIANYIDKKNLQLGNDIFFLISSDANHYGKDFKNTPYGEDEKAHKTATDNDKRIAETCLNTGINTASVKKLTDELWEGNPAPVWCGRYSIPFGLLTISKVAKLAANKSVEGKVFKYSDTVTEGVLPVKNTKLGLTAPANYQHWCGWLSAGFYLK